MPKTGIDPPGRDLNGLTPIKEQCCGFELLFFGAYGLIWYIPVCLFNGWTILEVP